MIGYYGSLSLTAAFSEGVALVGRFDLPPLGDFSRGVAGFAAFSAALGDFSLGAGDFPPFSPLGLFAFADRLPDCGLFALAC